MKANVGEEEARSHWTEQTMHERLKIQVGTCRLFTHGISYPPFRPAFSSWSVVSPIE